MGSINGVLDVQQTILDNGFIKPELSIIPLFFIILAMPAPLVPICSSHDLIQNGYHTTRGDSNGSFS